MRARSLWWWVLPVLGMLSSLALLFLAVRAARAGEPDGRGLAVRPPATCRVEVLEIRSPTGEVGYGYEWGPRENRQSMTVWGVGSTAIVEFESYEAPTSRLAMRGPVRQRSTFPREAVALLARRLVEDPPP